MFAGLSNIELGFEKYELGHGITIRRTCACLTIPFMMGFNPEPPTKYRSVPWTIWKTAAGSRGFDVVAELHVPATFASEGWGDPLRVVRYIVALVRMWSTPNLTVPVVSNTSFNEAARAPDHSVNLVGLEVEPRGLRVQTADGQELKRERMEWVRDHWQSGRTLLTEHKEFDLAVQALDQAHFVRDPTLALVSVWAAIEGLFSPSHVELTFRVSALLASYLEERGPKRVALQDRLAKLYGARSRAAHGKAVSSHEVLVESMEVLRAVLFKMISESCIPSRKDLNERLLG